jgi:large subunit ribosomal protein L29
MAKAKATAKTTKTAADIKQMTDDQIQTRITEIAKEQMNLRFQKASGQPGAPKAPLILRKENARLKTEATARRAAKK